MSHEERTELWRSRISDYRDSGERVATWCARHEVTPHQLYYWMQKLKKADRQAPAANGPKWVAMSLEGLRSATLRPLWSKSAQSLLKCGPALSRPFSPLWFRR